MVRFAKKLISLFIGTIFYYFTPRIEANTRPTDERWWWRRLREIFVFIFYSTAITLWVSETKSNAHTQIYKEFISIQRHTFVLFYCYCCCCFIYCYCCSRRYYCKQWRRYMALFHIHRYRDLYAHIHWLTRAHTQPHPIAFVTITNDNMNDVKNNNHTHIYQYKY